MSLLRAGVTQKMRAWPSANVSMVCFPVSTLIAPINISFGGLLVPLSRQFGWFARAISFVHWLLMQTNGLSAFGIGRVGDKDGFDWCFASTVRWVGCL
jgi:hypothetical protein